MQLAGWPDGLLMNGAGNSDDQSVGDASQVDPSLNTKLVEVGIAGP